MTQLVQFVAREFRILMMQQLIISSMIGLVVKLYLKMLG